MYKAKFKTAYLQREISTDVIIAGNMHVGELGVIVPATDKMPAIINKLAAADVEAAGKEANIIIAQSDMTMEYGHVPVEDRDYRYSDIVKSKVDNTILSTANYIGVYDNVADLPKDTSVVDASIALVYTAPNTLTKYKYTKSTTAWAKASPEATFKISDLVKKVSFFNIIDKTDIIVYDEQ